MVFCMQYHSAWDNEMSKNYSTVKIDFAFHIKTFHMYNIVCAYYWEKM